MWSQALADLDSEALHDVRQQTTMLLDELLVFLGGLREVEHYESLDCAIDLPSGTLP